MPNPPAQGSPPDPSFAPKHRNGTRQRESLMSVFVSCRTTLEDLSRRTGAYGDALAVSVLAAYLTGRCNLPAASHNVVAGALNLRLRELSRPAAAAYRGSGDERS